MKGGEKSMESTERAIQLQFDVLVKRVIDRTTKDYNKSMKRRAKKAISFSELSESELNNIYVRDIYDECSAYFEIEGVGEVKVNDERLIKALNQLPERKRAIILMFYFLEIPDAEIAKHLSVARNTSFRNRKSSLEKMREILMKEEKF